jgi:hypothetical protein
MSTTKPMSQWRFILLVAGSLFIGCALYYAVAADSPLTPATLIVVVGGASYIVYAVRKKKRKR